MRAAPFIPPTLYARSSSHEFSLHFCNSIILQARHPPARHANSTIPTAEMDSDAPIVLGDDPPIAENAAARRARDRAEAERIALFWSDVRLHDERRHRIANNRYRAYGPPEFDSILPPVITPRHPDPDVILPPGTPIPLQFPAQHVLARYPSLLSAFEHLSPTAIELGFALVKGSTLQGHNGRKQQLFTCHMGPTRGKGSNAEAYAAEEPCKFSIMVVNSAARGWFKAYANNVRHSHDACDPYGTPAMLRVYLKLHDSWIRGFVEMDRPPREIMARMQERGIPFNRRALYRHAETIRAEIRPHTQGKFPSHAALKELEDSADISVPWIDANGRLEGMLFATKKARALSQRFGSLFMIDFTFKTNAYNLPLLHIVGKTNTNSTFTSALVVLPNQAETTITEAIQAWKDHVMLSTSPRIFVTDRERAIVNALKSVFPEAAHISCQFHVKRNVHTYALRAGDLDLTDAEEFVETWAERVMHCSPPDGTSVDDAIAEGHAWLRRSFGNRNKRGFLSTLHYCKVDLAPLEPFFVDGHINSLPHLDTATTSPAEGTHASLKRWFLAGRPNLADFVIFSRKFMNLQYGSWASEMSQTASKPSRQRDERLRQVSRNLVRRNSSGCRLTS